MIGSRPRPLYLRARRRASRRTAAGAAAGIALAHLVLLLVLNANAPKAPQAPKAAPPHGDFAMVRLQPPNPARPRSRRRRNDAPRLAGQAKPSTAPVRAPTAEVQPQPSSPAKPDYGRWTAAPQAAPVPAIAPGLSACTPLTLPTMTGAAREACERRLSQSARAVPALPLIGDKRKREEFQAWADYQDQLRAYKASPEINAHPCPPQKIPKHGAYLDKCGLVNGALVIKVR